MDLAAINAFVAVGDKGGFRTAAAALGMTPAGVSKAVARLERQLGVTLLARTTRSVRLTSIGATFHARCKAILADLDHAGEAAAEGAAQIQGRLVISMTRAFGRSHVMPVIADFMRRNPRIEVEARSSDKPADLVADGIDVAVRIGELRDSTLVASRVGSTRFVLCGSPAYLEATGIPAHPAELIRHHVVGYVAPDSALRFAYRFMIDGSVRTIAIPARLTVDDGDALVSAGVRSAGLVMANDYLMAQELSQGTLVRILRDFELPPIPISVVHLPQRNRSRAAQTFATMLRHSLASGPLVQSS